jgi:ketosteroid isomerase-like protein
MSHAAMPGGNRDLRGAPGAPLAGRARRWHRRGLTTTARRDQVSVTTRTDAAAEDLARVRAWFAELAEHVRAVDFAAARHLFAPDLIAFGTFTDFIDGREGAEAAQWRNVWQTIDGFAWRLDGVRALVSPDRLFAVGMGVWDSTGYREDGTPFDRRGRATVSFSRAAIGEPWVATHTHMSLFRGTPAASHGRKAMRS